MRHGLTGRQLSRNTPHRWAMLRNMAASLLRHEAIRTTVPKAKELRRYVEPLITLGKSDSLANRRRAFARLRDTGDGGEAVWRSRTALPDAPGWLHAHPAHGEPPRGFGADGVDGAGRVGGRGRPTRRTRAQRSRARARRKPRRPRRRPRRRLRRRRLRSRPRRSRARRERRKRPRADSRGQSTVCNEEPGFHARLFSFRRPGEAVAAERLRQPRT